MVDQTENPFFRSETERLILRPFRMEDAEAFAAYRSDPQVAAYQGWEAPYSLEQARHFCAAMSQAVPGIPGEWYQIALELKSNGEMIGELAFFILKGDERQAEIGFTLARRYHGQGYAGEAVERLLAHLLGERRLHRVRANCDVENAASARLLERVGMRREAHLVESLWFKGRWSSEYWYAILQREWEPRQRK
jgi:RimJ/RimL family protein N-acetyltransferase